ncbi:organoarsenical effux MFS transporter ArsJ [Motilimonas pumila]|uniref:MFS transporter n=1 Tax=Motilimonas pumila TaxID=2303987 RepID=A0A418YEW9_9GAMM|nr:organoarsenical effux MFS transporter ArsJ [Motilimonas pumila]RJG47734.1 MFS transporter [Motilimonas pumila]
MRTLSQLPTAIKQYLIVTGNYWAFTLTDGALRMLVVLHFHQLGYDPFAIAMLFVFYEFFGVVTNLLGGWLGARIGLNKTMNLGLGLQIIALAMLLVPGEYLSVVLVMAAQALSGIAKDLNKMSAKSAVKQLVPKDAESQLYRWVALLTGSKNALKGVGFFLGGALLTLFGFTWAIAIMAAGLSLVWLFSIVSLKQDIGKAKNKPKFKDIFSKSRAINVLSGARMCLFAARDVWFVIAVPVYMASEFGWSHTLVGSFMAAWVIGYGIVQAQAPKITGKQSGQPPSQYAALIWAAVLACVTLLLTLALNSPLPNLYVLPLGLLVFGAVFAVNSSLHSYLIVSFAKEDGVSLDVGFYYMANAMGRLIGTVLSGWVYQIYGLSACLWIAFILLIITCAISILLSKHNN